MRILLIPTDYQCSTLDCIPNLCMQAKNEEFTFIFIHMFKLSDSIGELLMLSRRSREFEQISDEFYEQCEALKSAYPQIKKFKMEFLYGNTLRMFRNFIEDNEVDGVLDLPGHPVGKINKASIDPQILIQKSGLPIVTAVRASAQKEAGHIVVPQTEMLLGA